jgi:hypothetical protein
MLNAAPPGRNPDRPARTCDAAADSPDPDAVLLTENGTLRIRFSSCTGRGIDNGAGTAQASRGIVQTIMAPIHAGYPVNGDLPG